MGAGRGAEGGPCYQGLDLRFGVRCDDPATDRYLARALGPLGAGGRPEAWYTVSAGEGRHEVRFGSEVVANALTPAGAAAMVLWHVNRSVVRASGRYVLLHASAAARAGRAVVMPARMESGKTTLVAGLVRAGLDYLTDEAAAVDPTTLMVHPFPKSLSVDPGSWGVLADLRPRLAPEEEQFQAAQWHVDPRSIRPGAVAGPAQPELVVTPRYQAGADTELRPLSRARALVALCENSFNVADHGRAGVEALAEVCRRTRCFELVVGDLDDACALVLAELDGPAGPAPDAAPPPA